MDQNVRAVLDELDSRIAQEQEKMRAWDIDWKDINADEFALVAGPDSAAFLNLLIRTKGARNIVEVGPRASCRRPSRPASGGYTGLAGTLSCRA